MLWSWSVALACEGKPIAHSPYFSVPGNIAVAIALFSGLALWLVLRRPEREPLPVWVRLGPLGGLVLIAVVEALVSGSPARLVSLPGLWLDPLSHESSPDVVIEAEAP
jgi:hypothetical protein